MKKRLLLLPLLGFIVACSPSNPSATTNDYILAYLLDGVNVKIEGKETKTFPSEYSYLDEEVSFSIDRDYDTIKEKNGSLTPAIRENSEGSFTTYFRGSDGAAVGEFYSAKNEVVTSPLRINGNRILFNEYFANPFEYIDSTDIGEDYTLNPVKAGFVVESYTGLQYAVSEAKFVVEDKKATALNIKLHKRMDLIAESETSNILIESHAELSINFAYDIGEINHLSPRKAADNTIKKAFTNLNNYTLQVTTDASETSVEAYVTNGDVFLHQGVGTVGLVNGDRYYKNIGDGYYDEYIYLSESNEFILSNFDTRKEQFIPNYDQFSSNILLKDSDNVYEFDYAAAKYGLEAVMLPGIGTNDGSGLQGYVTLKNGKIDEIKGSFDSSMPFTVTQKFMNQGTTSMPSWLDVSLIK